MDNISISKRINALFILLILFFFFATPLFAQAAVDKMNDAAETIKKALTSNLVKTILVIAFIGAGIAFAVNKDSQRIRNSAIAIGVGAVIIGAASYIVELVWIE